MVENNTNQELWQERLDLAFKNTLDDGEMILRWVAVAEVIDADGDKLLYTMESPGLMSWDTLGLLDTAITRERDYVSRIADYDAQEDDD